jgi:hypothetical protein
MIANPLLILQENQGKICFNSTDFDATETELPEV